MTEEVITVWRLAKAKYSKDGILSGKGSADWGGRWNSKGKYLVYTSDSLALAAFEVLVHMGDKDVLAAYNSLSMDIPISLIERLDEEDLPDGWDADEINTPAQAIGDEWIDSLDSAALMVPAVTISTGFNILINPNHADFKALSDSALVAPFKFDKRLMKKTKQKKN